MKCRLINDCRCAVIRSKEVPGAPFGWTTFPETTVRALFNEMRREVLSHPCAAPIGSDCNCSLLPENPRRRLCRCGILDHGIHLQFDHVCPLGNVLGDDRRIVSFQ
jgi:hypothetical protein